MIAPSAKMVLVLTRKNSKGGFPLEKMPQMSRKEFLRRRERFIKQQQQRPAILFSNNNSDDYYGDNDYYDDEEESLFDQMNQPDGPRHHWVRIILITILTLAVIFAGWEYYKVHHASKEIFANKTDQVSKKVVARKPITVLAMGTDVGALNRGNTGGNTDSLELFVINPKSKTTTMISIPRDTLVRANTKRGVDYVKINALYSIGGPKLVTKQVSELLDVPIDYYALINMGALQEVVNSVGGVNVNNPFAFDYEGHHFKQGPQHLNGELALKYSRMRYDDPNNDYGRQKRQQEILLSVINNFKHHGSLHAANQILDAVGDGVKTDVPVNEVKWLYKGYRPALQNVKMEHFQGQNAMIEGASFQVASTQEINRVSKLIHQLLGTKYHPVTNHETRMFDSQPDYHGQNTDNFILPGHAHYNDPGSGDGSDRVISAQEKARIKSDAMTLTSRDIFGK